MMLDLATFLLATAVALGGVAAVMSLRAGGAPAPFAIAGTHATLALGGYGLLLVALAGPPRGSASGAASFGPIAAVLLALAVLAGVALLQQRRRRTRLPGGLIGVHATLAVFGFVILAVYALLA
ncbi:MAG TPA: hypothetical protein VLV50_12840 [Stellaceae bacterium]|nr:hypothetical protein [Stellaceae bacterium]